jgi:hypothetical protein
MSGSASFQSVIVPGSRPVQTYRVVGFRSGYDGLVQTTAVSLSRQFHIFIEKRVFGAMPNAL